MDGDRPTRRPCARWACAARVFALDNSGAVNASVALLVRSLNQAGVAVYTRADEGDLVAALRARRLGVDRHNGYRLNFFSIEDVAAVALLDVHDRISNGLLSWSVGPVRPRCGTRSHPASASGGDAGRGTGRAHRRLVFARDVPWLPRAVPRYLPADADRALAAALRASPNPLPAGALLLLRATGMRIGELLDLELDCVHEVPGAGAWLKVPLGKLDTERMVPIDEDALALLDQITEHRSPGRPLPHPRTGKLADFLLTCQGRRVSADTLRGELHRGAGQAGIGPPRRTSSGTHMPPPWSTRAYRCRR